jgi:integrin beta 2
LGTIRQKTVPCNFSLEKKILAVKLVKKACRRISLGNLQLNLEVNIYYNLYFRLLWQNLTHPRSIVVDPMRGFMYWSDWPPGLTGKETTFDMTHQEKGIIETSWLDGSNRRPFVDQEVVWANGLSVDWKKGRLFWCDSYLQTLESVNIESGSDRMTHLSNNANPGIISRPYGLSFHNDLLLWSEFEKGHIMQLDLKNNETTLIKEENPQLFSLKVFDKDKQPDLVGHSCLMSDCQDLCLPVPNGFRCACRDGQMLGEDKKSCLSIDGWTPPSHCGDNQFQCAHNQRCIDLRYM